MRAIRPNRDIHLLPWMVKPFGSAPVAIMRSESKNQQVGLWTVWSCLLLGFGRGLTDILRPSSYVLPTSSVSWVSLRRCGFASPTRRSDSSWQTQRCAGDRHCRYPPPRIRSRGSVCRLLSSGQRSFGNAAQARGRPRTRFDCVDPGWRGSPGGSTNRLAPISYCAACICHGAP